MTTPDQAEPERSDAEWLRELSTDTWDTVPMFDEEDQARLRAIADKLARLPADVSVEGVIELARKKWPEAKGFDFSYDCEWTESLRLECSCVIYAIYAYHTPQCWPPDDCFANETARSLPELAAKLKEG